MQRRRAVAGLAAVAALAYSWWATGLTPFHTDAYASVAVPIVLVAVAAFVPARDKASHPVAAWDWRWRQALPWLALLLAVLGLEAAGLAVGGRSSALPTLSDVVDHFLRWHAERFVLFGCWLAIGACLVRSARHAGARR